MCTALEDAHDHGLPVVHLELFAEREGFLGPKLLEAIFIHEDRVGMSQVAEIAERDILRSADERGVVEADEDHLLEGAIGEPAAVDAFVEPHRPGHARHTANAIEVVFAHRLDIVDELDLAVHDPNVGPANVLDLADGKRHQPAEDRALLGNEERGECHAEHNADELGGVARQHFERDPAHRQFPSVGLPRPTFRRTKGEGFAL